MNFFFHLGITKTGSTAIQNFLYKNTESLIKFGYYYPNLEIVDDEGIYRTSGNGNDLCRELISKKDFPEKVKETIVDWISNQTENALLKGCNNIIISSENFCVLPKHIFQEFLTSLPRDTQFTYKFILFNREPYAWYFSAWLQQVERQGYSNWLGNNLIPALIDSELQPLSIENIIKESCYKNHVICFNYNDCKNRLIETFLNSIGVKSTEFNIENTRINRTMSRNEFIMIYFINKFSKNNERLNEILNKLQIDNNRSISFFFFDEVVADKIYSYCDSKEIAYTKIKYSSEVFCSESDFFESLSAEERYTIDIFKNVINFYSIFLEEAVALAIHKEKFYEFSEYKNLVPLNFNLFVYIMLNRDVLFSTCDPYEHYLKFGIEDNRSWCLDLI